jgi:hypothetical protein
MKKQTVLILALTAGIFYFFFQQKTESRPLHSTQSQARVFTELRPQMVRAAAFGISPKASSFAPAAPEPGVTGKKSTADERARAVPNNLPFRKLVEGAPRDAESRFAQIASVPMPAPLLSFDGLSSNDNAAAFGFRVIPPDTFGDVGPDHYVQAVNTLVRVYDKQGNPLTPPFKMSSLFAPLKTPCSLRNDGDPIVLYDALADRWLLSQFCTQFPPFRQMVAVSKTGDPTGEYYIYEFVMPNMKLNDYSKIGVWSDAFLMTTDQFFGSDYAGTGVFAFDKNRMLAGDPEAGYIYFDLASPTTLRIGGMLPADLDGLRAPPAGAPGLFLGYAATEYGDAADALRIFELHADFQNPEASTFAERAESPLEVAPFDPTSVDGRADIAQPPPGEKLDAQSDRLMYRVGYRNFGTHESLVLNQTVRTSPIDATYRAGVRVYELRKTNGVFTVFEQVTIGGDDLSRWMAAAAQDHKGNLAVGYSASNEDRHPAILYAGRTVGDPPGVFRSETPLIQGTGVQRAFGFRWGDYSGLSIDPADDCSFWITNEYYTLESEEESDFGWLTRIGKFRFEECDDAPRAAVTGTVVNAVTGQPIENASVKADAVYTRSTNAAGSYGSLMLLPGTYELTAAARGYRPQTVEIALSDDQTLTQNFALQPTAVFEDPVVSISTESCAQDGAIDPGETVTIEIGLQNAGAAAATDLTATLLPTGGVTAPSAPQNYGALPPGGPTVSRPFTFTASNALDCGDDLTLTFQLNDGAEDLGTVSVSLRTGRVRIAFEENFDDLPLPDLPAGWTTGAVGGQQPWKTTENRFQTPPNAAFSPDPNQVGLNELVTPPIEITSTEAVIEFQNWYELETTFLRNRLYDGSVLEIKIGLSNWRDIEAAGGSFISGGYDGVIDTCCQNPLGGRRGWSGKSGIGQTPVFITSKARLPASAAGQSVRFRWRVGTDIGTFREGQYIDDVKVMDGFECACRTSAAKSVIFDFDGDGKTDVSVFRPTDAPGDADFYILNSSTNAVTSASWGSTGDRAANADYDGDGKTDTAVFRPQTQTWFILRSSDFSIETRYFGLADDKLTPGDYDGDGRADLAVFRPATGVWYVLQRADGQIHARQFGIDGDAPVAADYDGDGKTDLAVFRPATGVWYVSRSSDGGFTALQFGLAGDLPVAGDYDGDARADFAVFRPAEGNWYLLGSRDGFTAVNFGLAEDRPLQGDFDGDGRRDIAVFRPSNSAWYVLKSSDGGLFGVEFGLSGDTPVPSIFVP